MSFLSDLKNTYGIPSTFSGVKRHLETVYSYDSSKLPNNLFFVLEDMLLFIACSGNLDEFENYLIKIKGDYKKC